jgi:hypothetical protein
MTTNIQPGPPTWQPPVPRPPLTPELKRAATRAGVLGFIILGIGWSLVAVALFAAFFASLVSFIMGIMARVPGEGDQELEQFTSFIETLNPSAWVIPLVIAGIVGVILMVLALYLSAGILKRAGHPSPWAVTWAGAGVGIAASSIVGWVAAIPGQVAGIFSPGGGSIDAAIPGLVIGVALWAIFTIGLNGVIGWLSWWWMAHALRPAASAPGRE